MPEIEYAFLADAADARPGEKFAVLGGGVSRIGGPGFPLGHPHLAMVVGLRVTTPELGSEHDLHFVILAPDGSQLSSASARISAAGPGDGRDTVVTFSLDLWNLTFPVPGEYGIAILVDGSERKRLALAVERQESPPGTVGARGDDDRLAPPFPPPTGKA